MNKHIVLVCVLGLAPEALAEAEAPGLRDAKVVLADYVAAIGGEKAWKRRKTMRLRREIEAKGMGIRGTDERFATASGKALSVTTLPAIGTIKVASNGRIRWSEDPINGLRVLEGAEDEETRIEGTWNADLQLAKLYQKVRSVPPPSPPPAGRRYECVELTPKLGKPAVACFDAQTHLRALQTGVKATPQGDVPYSATFTDWRDVEGVRVPFAEELTAGPMTMTARIAEIRFDVKLDAKMFELPKAPGSGAQKKK